MTFRLTCPVCGKRDVYEFTYGGPERGPRPAETDLDGGAEAHFRWSQFRMNRLETREEWWHHGAGCGVWFSAWRNPATNREELPGGSEAGGNEASEGDSS